MLRFTETLAHELHRIDSQVCVVTMGPGLVMTEMTRSQVDTEAGRTWIPSTAISFAEGRTRPPEDCARATVDLLRWMNPSLSGRTFHVGADFEELARRCASSAISEALLLRLNGPPSRGFVQWAARVLSAMRSRATAALT